MTSDIPKENRRETIYAMWVCWKERNRRIFQNSALQPDMVAHLVWEEMAKRAFAHTQDPGG